MIDDEDEEEILNKSVSLKKVLKNVLLILLIGVGAVFIYLGGENQMTNFMIGFSLICLGTSLIQIQKQTQEPIRQTLTILMCNLCNITNIRHYEHGDYVFKEIGSCDKCNESMRIKQIYNVKLKKPTIQTKKSEGKKEKEEVKVKV